MSEYEGDLSQLVYELNLTKPAQKLESRSERRTSLDALLESAAQQNASDILLVAGSPSTLRINGSLAPASGKVLTAEDLRNALLPLLTSEQTKELEASRALDFCFVRGSTGRFRANLHYQRGTLAASIRLLPAQIPTIESLHLPPILARLTERRQGLILLTGPTGSGKTSTMAALIERINARRRDHIITIEDPVEYQIRGITQIPVNEKKGLTFARGLRSILRHDPDKILVGEIRDAETAQIAINSALTGHLVFTTVHANNVVDVLGRFLNMGVEPYNFVSALNCILAQRLVRQICPFCVQEVHYSDAELIASGLVPAEWRDFKFREGTGCMECAGTGFRGRSAIHELLELDDEIREMLLAKRPGSEIRKKAKEKGMGFLRDSAIERVREGITTLKEINKVTFIEAGR
jgi:pilus retraction protein PilT